MNEIQKAYEAAKESYETQIEGLREIHDKELQEREEALQTYRAAIDTLERLHREGLREIEERTREDRTALEEDHTERPVEIINEIEQQFGFEYVE